MNADSYYEQGHGHEICQDYATHGETQHFVYAIVSDGCSGSPKSDIGSRILAETFVSSMTSLAGDDDIADFIKIFHKVVLDKLEDVNDILKLPETAYDATLLALVYDKTRQKLYTFIWGDGVLYLRYKHSEAIQEMKYASNAPYYLSYAGNPERAAAYEKEFGSNGVTCIASIKYPNTIPSQPEIGKLSAYFFKELPLENLELALVTSDGTSTYIGEDGQFLSTEAMLPNFTTFKSTAGNFVQRRMRKLRKEIKAAGREHYDDISVAAISFNETKLQS